MPNDLRVEMWSTSWCGPCKNIKKELAGWKAGEPPPTGGGLVRKHLEPLVEEVVVRDAEESMSEASSLGIRAVPHWELYRNGQRVGAGFSSAAEVARAISS